MKLTSENVRLVENRLLDDIDYWGLDDKEAEKTLAYIAGIRDMASAIIRAIMELGGK